MTTKRKICLACDKGFVIHNVRMESAAGHYLGSLWFSSMGEGAPNDRDSWYYPNEQAVRNDYPRSISMKEAFDQAQARLKRYNRR